MKERNGQLATELDDLRAHADKLELERDSFEQSCANYGHRLCVLQDHADKLASEVRRALDAWGSGPGSFEQTGTILEAALADYEKEAAQ